MPGAVLKIVHRDRFPLVYHSPLTGCVAAFLIRLPDSRFPCFAPLQFVKDPDSQIFLHAHSRFLNFFFYNYFMLVDKLLKYIGVGIELDNQADGSAFLANNQDCLTTGRPMNRNPTPLSPYYRSLTRNMVLLVIVISFTPMLLVTGIILKPVQCFES